MVSLFVELMQVIFHMIQASHKKRSSINVIWYYEYIRLRLNNILTEGLHLPSNLVYTTGSR